MDLCEFEASLTVRATQRNPVSQNLKKKKIFYVLSACMYIHTRQAPAKKERKASDCLDLEFRTELRSSVRTTSVLNCQAISPAP